MSAAGSDHRSAVLSQLPGGPSWGQVCPPAWPCPARQEPPIKEGHLDGSNERHGWRRWGGKAALARYPGATVLRVETDSDGVYEAHLTTTDGRRVTIEATRPSR
jgi:hypothetical protein